jgi:hypothetical protein
MTRLMELERTSTEMELVTQVNGSKISNTAMELKRGKMGLLTKAVTSMQRSTGPVLLSGLTMHVS